MRTELADFKAFTKLQKHGVFEVGIRCLGEGRRNTKPSTPHLLHVGGVELDAGQASQCICIGGVQLKHALIRSSCGGGAAGACESRSRNVSAVC